MYKKILIGIDGSEDAHKALKKVIDFYKDWKSKIVVFHSIEHHLVPPVFPAFGTGYVIPDDSYSIYQRDFRKASEKTLEEAKKIFDKAGIPIETRLIEDIKPEEYAVDRVKKENFDLVVLGGKGHHSKLGALLGTVSTHVVNTADCDVLIVR
jgi:nucleotide-binding universal stress UspA family protein